MRVAFLVDVFPRLSETFILNQMIGLLELGHGVEVFSAARTLETIAHSQTTQYGLLDRTHFHNELPSGRVKRIAQSIPILARWGTVSPRVLLRSLDVFRNGANAASMRLLYKTDLFLSLGPFDIIFCHFGHNGVLGTTLKRIGIPGKVVTMLHGYDLRRAMASHGRVYRKLFGAGDCFLAISDYTKEKLISFGVPPEKIVRHPVGVHLEGIPFRWDRHQDWESALPIKILTVARLSGEKGLDYAIRTIRELVHDAPGIHLQYEIIGGGDWEKKLRTMIQESGLDGIVKLLGPKKQDGVRKALEKAHIFFLPSNVEVLPVALMEAMAAGLPIVATSVGAVPELVEDGKSGFLVPHKNTDAMKTALERLVRHPSLWPKMGAAGRSFVSKNHDVKRLNRRLEMIFRNIL